MEMYREEAAKKKREMVRSDVNESKRNVVNINRKVEENAHLRQWEEYKRLCRQNKLPQHTNGGGLSLHQNSSSSVTKLLSCYLKKDKPYLKLAPHRMEVLHWDPLLVQFHNVISEEEIEIIKQLAGPKLTRATVVNADGRPEYASHRICQTAFVQAEEHPAIAVLNRRIEDMTNLDMETAFGLKVFKYVIGGHYMPHFDFSLHDIGGGKDPFVPEGTRGNRVATCLFYLKAPTGGGRTVFTELCISVAPTEHDALFWFNLKPDGQGDLRTKHAGCPVLTGEKWIFTKLINERGQEWIRPCPLTIDEEKRLNGDAISIGMK